MNSLARLPPSKRIARWKGVMHARRERLESALSIHLAPAFRQNIVLKLKGNATARQVASLAQHSDIGSIQILSVKGVPIRERKSATRWYSVLGLVHIVVEGSSAKPRTEDRWMLVRARNESQAINKLKREWRDYAKPYLNDKGNFVRWKLHRIERVESIGADLDPNGTEVAWSLH